MLYDLVGAPLEPNCSSHTSESLGFYSYQPDASKEVNKDQFCGGNSTSEDRSSLTALGLDCEGDSQRNSACVVVENTQADYLWSKLHVQQAMLAVSPL